MKHVTDTTTKGPPPATCDAHGLPTVERGGLWALGFVGSGSFLPSSLNARFIAAVEQRGMEPANIDWKNIESRSVRDEAYENINAPKWLDLAAPDASPVDDDAWFCRPGTDENNLKRRAGIAAPLLPVSPHKPKAAASKKFREDLENQDPNQSTPQRPSRPFGAPKKCNTAKEMIKSSAEKKVEEQREEPKQKKAQPRLKSTLSASNLFSGKDIMNQISEKDDASAKKSGKMAVRIEIEKSTALKEVRAYPPTPQRFRNPKATATGRSPLNKPPKSATLQKAIQQEMEQDKEEKKAILPVKGGEDCNRGAAAAADSDTEEGSSADFCSTLASLVNNLDANRKPIPSMKHSNSPRTIPHCKASAG
ncbi:hypothetical protein GW17_00035904 [Ensete ventricosum]|nr:hypothetical protein GW17_00035904 [Ensete ventricosum]